MSFITALIYIYQKVIMVKGKSYLLLKVILVLKFGLTVKVTEMFFRGVYWRAFYFSSLVCAVKLYVCQILSFLLIIIVQFITFGY